MATFTVPRQLRNLAWHHQRTLYALLFECAVSTLKTFGLNDKALGGELGLTAVLHTHSRRLAFHPHVHMIIPGGCYLRARRQWKKRRGQYLFNEINLATVFRARMLAAIAKAGFTLPANLPAHWVVHCDHVGSGLPALKYLSRYLYRGVIDENNILSDDGAQVTFRYRDSETNAFKIQRCNGEDFLWRVFQHALPKGFRRTRDYGFLHGNAAKIRQLIQMVLNVTLPVPEPGIRPAFICRRCRCPMRIIAFVPPSWRAG
ncbi:MAG TPA: transposase [Gammaproteobacteria bacterium]